MPTVFSLLRSRMALALGGMMLLPHGVAAADGATVALSEVVVTAERDRRRAEETTVSVSVLDGAYAARVGAADLEDLLGYTGNVALRLNPFGGMLSIRGFGNPGTNAGQESAVGSVIDGVFYGQPRFLAASSFDLEQVEVVRGPQGTLHGSNATAGLINLQSRAPEAENSARLALGYDSASRRVVAPAVNIDVSDAVALRVAGQLTRDRGRLFNTLLERPEDDLSQEALRTRLRIAPPGRDWRADIGLFHSRHRRNNGEFQFVRATDAMRAFARSYDPQFSDDPEDDLTSLDVGPRADIVLSGASLQMDSPIGRGARRGAPRLLSTTGWATARQRRNIVDADFTPAPFLRREQPGGSPYRQVSQELRLVGSVPSASGRHDAMRYTTGLYLLDSSLRVPDRFEILDLGAASGYLLAARAGAPSAGFAGGPVGGVGGVTAEALSALVDLLTPVVSPALGDEQRIDTLLDQRGRSVAAFGQADVALGPQWTLTGGLRLARERKSGFFRSEGQGQLVGLIGDQEDHESTRRIADTAVSPRIALRWAPAARVNLFAGWSRSFKSGGFNAIPLTPEGLSYARERASSYEAGLRARLPQARMQVSATAFWTDFADLQVSTFRDNRFFILNAAEARSRGAELDLTWLPPLRGSAVRLAVGVNDARFRRYPDAPAPAGADAETQDLSGRRLPRAPRVNAVLGPSYVLPLPAVRANLVLGGELQARGSRFLDVDLAPASRQAATLELSLRAAVIDFGEAWSLDVVGRNLTGAVIYQQILDQPLAPGNHVGIRADRGRYVTVGLTRALF